MNKSRDQNIETELVNFVF